MLKVEIKYNPYLVKTEMLINDKPIVNKSSKLAFVLDRRLQEWIEPMPARGWEGIFKELRDSTGDSDLCIEFTGTFGDFDDMVYAKERCGDIFASVELVHKNAATANHIEPYQKIKDLKNLYNELVNGPIDEFKDADIKANFENACNSDFRIVVVAPMSSGKSTLINSILGKDILPAVNQATTAVITEIRDNDSLDHFIVSATDKYGKEVVKNEKATLKLISELNYMKDPKDPEGKLAMIPTLQIEGPIPNLPSDALKTVFVDSPGGNNSQNLEHEQMMDDAINDENKSLILYVFDGTQLGTNDSNAILRKIANAMKNTEDGKLARDRFLFVANKMDGYDISKEPYEDAIEKTILPFLAGNGIEEPNLFLVSAQTAKLIRMMRNGDELSETDEENIETLIKRFNRRTRALPKYSSLGTTAKEKMLKAAEDYIEAANETDSRKEELRLKHLAAELNSGIPAVEQAIKEYLEKYAIAIKIKTVHDTFMGKVNERRMIDNCEAEWANSKEDYENAKAELAKKREDYAKNQKLAELKSKVDEIKLDTSEIEKKQMSVTSAIRKMVEGSKAKVKIEDAEYELAKFKSTLRRVGEEAESVLDNAVNNEMLKTCQKIVNEYASYVNELDASGMLSVGAFDMKSTNKFAGFDIKKADDLLNDKNYQKTEREEAGKRTVKKSGFFSGLARFFGLGGYETVTDYKNQTYVDFQRLVREVVTKTQNDFDKAVSEIINKTEKAANRLKQITNDKLNGLDKMIKEQFSQIENMLANQENLLEKVEENKAKVEWINDFVEKVDSLLNI